MTKKRGVKARIRTNAQDTGVSYTTSLRDLSNIRSKTLALAATALIGGRIRAAQPHLDHNPVLSRPDAQAAVARFVADTTGLNAKAHQVGITDDYLRTADILLALSPAAVLTRGQSWVAAAGSRQEGKTSKRGDAYLSQHVLLPYAPGGFYNITMELNFDGKKVTLGYSVVLETAGSGTFLVDAEEADQRLAAVKQFIVDEVVGVDAITPAEIEPMLTPADWLNSVLDRGIAAGGTDLYLYVDEAHERLEVRVAVGGRTRDLDRRRGLAVGSLLTHLDNRIGSSAETGRPPEASSFEVALYGEPQTVRCIRHESKDGSVRFVLRLPDLSPLRTLDQLGMSTGTVSKVRALLDKPMGVVLFAGPIRSGRTTSAYAALLHNLENGRTAFTVECPVEKAIPGVTQISQSAGITPSELADVTYHTIRFVADVLLFGELSGSQEANSHVLRQAFHGRQVLSTIHANDSLIGLLRLIENSDLTVGTVTNGVIAQKTVDRLNADWDGVDPATKYSGVAHLFEVLTVDDALRSAIKAGATLAELRRVADMLTFADDAKRLIAEGVTDADAVRRAL